MKKTLLLVSLCISAIAVNAQTYSPVTLSGTSYSQNFDGMTLSGWPQGWNGYLSATSSDTGTLYVDMISGSPVAFGSTSYGRYADSLGTDTLTGQCGSDIYGAGFKNLPSADAGAGTDQMTCAQEEAVTNRALGVRQTSATGYDGGAAFTFAIAKTSGRSSFHLTFNLQSLDILSPRVTTWQVDYGIGAATFTTVATTPSTLTTGGNTWSNTPVTVNFGTALNNSSQPVWIRIDALNSSTGPGSRTTSAIDDFNLTWTNSTTGITNVSAQPALSLTAIGMATSDKVTLAYNAEEAGNYNLSIYDLTGRIIHNQSVNAQAGTQVISVDGLHLASGMYIAKMSNGNSSSVARMIVQ